MGQVLVKDFYDVDDRCWRLDLPAGVTLEQARAMLAKASGIEVERQRLYHQGKRLTGLEQLNLKACNTVVLLRLPVAGTPSDAQVFAGGNLQSGTIDTAFLWRHFEHEGRLSVAQADAILTRAEKLLRGLPNLVEVHEPMAIVADVHGQWFDLALMFAAAGGLEAIDSNRQSNSNSNSSSKPPSAAPAPKQNFLFLGDYVDRGRWSSECTLFLLSLMINEPKRFTLLRGNHECRTQMKRQNTQQEFLDKYSEETFEQLVHTFQALPLAAIVHCGPHKMFCVHGGISPYVQLIAQINTVNRFVEPTDDKVVRDLTWSDPTDDVMLSYKPEEREWDLKTLDPASWPWLKGGPAAALLAPKGPLVKAMFQPNPSRGSAIGSYTLRALHVFLAQNDLLCVIRGHEQKDGFEFGHPGPKHYFPSLISSFSAPNYTDRSKNLGAVILCRDGVLSIREYDWRIHPCYDRDSRKDLVREDFHVMIHHLRPGALKDLTEEQLDATFASIAPVKKRELNRRDMWALLRRNLERVPFLAQASSEDLHRTADTLAAWFARVDHLRRGKASEAEHERESASPIGSSSCGSRPGSSQDTQSSYQGSSQDDEERPYEVEPGEKDRWAGWPFSLDNGAGAAKEKGQGGAYAAGSVEEASAQLLGGLGGRSFGDKAGRSRTRTTETAAGSAVASATWDGQLGFEAAEETRMLREAFDLFDEDGSGAITATELPMVLQQLGKDVTQEQSEDILAHFDRDYDKQLSFPEFEDLVRDHFCGPERLERAMEAAWKVFDANGDNSLSCTELKNVMTRLGYPMSDEDVASMLDTGDEDGNLLLSWQEFKQQILSS